MTVENKSQEELLPPSKLASPAAVDDTPNGSEEPLSKNAVVRTWRRLNRQLLITPKLLYFFLNLEFYAFYTFRGSFIKDYLGLDKFQYGLLMSVMALVSFPCMSLWGRVADWLGRPRLVLAVLAVATAGAFALLSVPWNGLSQMAEFAWVTFSLVTYSFFSSGLMPLMDTITLRLLAKENIPNSKDLYGRQRLWGSVGYVVSCFLAAFAMDALGNETLFGLIPVCALVFTAVLFLAGPADTPKPIFRRGRERDIEDAKNIDAKVEEELEESHGSRVARIKRWFQTSPTMKLLLDPGYLFFLGAVFMTGSARSIMTNFLALYWEKEMLVTKKLVAVLSAFGVAVEIAIFFFAPYLCRIMGNYWMLLLAQLAMLLRGWLYVILPPRDYLFPAACAIELLKGTAFGFTQVAGVKVASESAPPELQATSQAIYTSIYSQLPAVIAALLGGHLYNVYGAKLLFTVTAAISTASFVLFFVKWSWDGSIPTLAACRKRPPSTTSLPQSPLATG